MSDLLVSVEGPLVRLTINREDRRNALNGEVLHGLRDALTVGPAAAPEARVVLVDSVGSKAFCAGADLAVMSSDATGLELHEARGGLREVILAMRDCPVPVVAAVQGLCLAGGVGLAMGCDVVIAAEGAQFGLPEVDLGLWPFMVSALLARHVSPKVAMDLMLSGERISAERGAAIGLISRVVPDAGLEPATNALLAELAAKPPLAVRLGKAAFHAAQETTLGPALAAMQAQLSLLTQTEDAKEGVSAFFAKRPANYRGR